MGKGAGPTIGYWYLPAFHVGLGIGPIDAYLEARGGDKTAWTGSLTESGTIHINAPNLWGGEKDQGGIVGDVDVMFGETDQQPNQYLIDTFGDQQPAWRGLATLVFKGGKYGAMSPYPQPMSHKICKILKGWDGDVCWYPEKAKIFQAGEVVLAEDAEGWDYQVIDDHEDPGYTDLLPPEASWATARSPFAGGSLIGTGHTNWPIHKVLWIQRVIYVPMGKAYVLRVTAENGCVVFVNGAIVGAVNRDNEDIDNNQNNVFEFTLTAGINHHIAVKAFDEAGTGGGGTFLSLGLRTLNDAWMNPAHALYYARTHVEIGREPLVNMNDASYRAGADKLYAEVFGICTEYDPSAESLVEFEQRICKLIGGSVNRSLIDGQWYLDLARGDYVLEDLPILTDDDILSFSEQPSILDNAINSISVKYFDPQRKESIVTPPVQALALIDAFGTIHQVNDYPEIPYAELAGRVGERDARTSVTPTRAFELATKRTPYGWRPNTYFRLQAPKRGIADLVCLLGSKETGTLKSGAIKITAAQDIYNLPDASFIEVEHGVDTRPPQTPVPIVLQRTFEAPYFNVAANLTRADLAVLPEETGYLLAVAAEPALSRDYTMMVAPDGGDYVEANNGDWCPNAIAAGAIGLEPGPTVVMLTAVNRLGQVAVGAPVLVDDEICRVDALDLDVPSVTLGRGCADTVTVEHVAGSRLWFYDDAVAYDPTEYTDGETVDVKLLTNTGSQQLPIDSATAMELTFDQRQFRPYPPAKLRVNGQWAPAEAIGPVTVTGVHRDRLMQADQLVDNEAASIGPEVGTTYTFRWYLNGVLEHTDSGLPDPAATYEASGGGLLRIESEAVRDGLASWQMQVRELSIGAPLLAETGDLITTEDDQSILME